MAKNWQHKKSRYQNNTLSIGERGKKRYGRKGDKMRKRDIEKQEERKAGIYG